MPFLIQDWVRRKLPSVALVTVRAMTDEGDIESNDAIEVAPGVPADFEAACAEIAAQYAEAFLALEEL